MSNTPSQIPSIVPPQLQQISLNGNGMQVAIGLVVTLATVLGTRLTTGTQVDNVRLNQEIVISEIKEISARNEALNRKILELVEESKRLNQKDVDNAAQVEARQKFIIEKIEALEKKK
jgi:uncharacterized protein HemX